MLNNHAFVIATLLHYYVSMHGVIVHSCMKFSIKIRRYLIQILLLQDGLAKSRSNH